MSTRSPRLATAAVLTAMILVLAGCGGADGDDSTAAASSTPSPSRAAPTSASPTPPSPEDQAVADATAMVVSYYAKLDQVNADPNADLNSLRDVAANDALTVQERIARQTKTRGRVQIGSSRVISSEAFSVDLSTDPAATPPRYPTVVIDTCVDVREVNVVDSNGQSVVLSTRLPKSADRLSVVQFDFGWRVNTVEYQGQPCDA
jgi:hypothetical protein